MNQYQKKVLIIIFSILILIAIVAIIWGVYISNNQVDPNIPPDDSGESGNQFTTDITVLNDYNEFFTVSKIINDYYLDLVSRDTDTILSLLDEDYKEEMGIQSNNVFRIIPCDYTSATYTPMEIYYNEDSIVTYYFVSGYLENVDFIEDTSLYYEQINFLVMVNKNTRHYAITLLDDNLNIEDYAKSYDLIEKELEYNTYTDVNTTVETILITYLNVFRDLLFLDNERAYDMLADTTKERYHGAQDFYQHQEEIYDYVPSTVFGYSRSEEDEQVIYRLTDSSQNSFTIYEYGVMNYQISY